MLGHLFLMKDIFYVFCNFYHIDAGIISIYQEMAFDCGDHTVLIFCFASIVLGRGSYLG